MIAILVPPGEDGPPAHAAVTRWSRAIKLTILVAAIKLTVTGVILAVLLR